MSGSTHRSVDPIAFTEGAFTEGGPLATAHGDYCPLADPHANYCTDFVLHPPRQRVTPENMTGRLEPVRITAAHVSANWFTLLGVNLEAGRAFAVGDDGPQAQPVVVLSDAIWWRQFGADPRRSRSAPLGIRLHRCAVQGAELIQ